MPTLDWWTLASWRDIPVVKTTTDTNHPGISSFDAIQYYTSLKKIKIDMGNAPHGSWSNQYLHGFPYAVDSLPDTHGMSTLPPPWSGLQGVPLPWSWLRFRNAVWFFQHVSEESRSNSRTGPLVGNTFQIGLYWEDHVRKKDAQERNGNIAQPQTSWMSLQNAQGPSSANNRINSARKRTKHPP